MKVLVVGGGGREHALVRALAADPQVDEVHALPGNPGIATVARLHPGDPLDGSAIADLAGSLGIDLVVVGPEAPLVAGVADVVRERGVACFGPGAEAARIEGSKAFAKKVMASAGIPTAMARICETPEQVDEALDAYGSPYIVKDDALAAGKGVVVTTDRATARAHALGCRRVVIEEYLDGPEVSVFAICDGTSVLPMIPAQDFKRLGDGDQGPNTGGMGAFAPLSHLPASFVADVERSVLQPCIDELRRRGTPFIGLLYAGLALTARGLQVVEFNARFGDPETQPLLELLETPLAGVLMAAARGHLDRVEGLRWRNAAAVTVVMSSAGYPEAPRTGDVITGIEDADAIDGVVVLQAGTTSTAAGEVATSGGRVLGVTATAATVAEARALAYQGVDRISFDGAHFRTDIAGSPG